MMKKDKEWEQLRCPGCGKRKLDAKKPYAISVWCRECKKIVVFNADVDNARMAELKSHSDL